MESMLTSSLPSDDPSENSLDLLLVHTRHNLQGKWTEDADFFAKFFPVDSYTREAFSTSRKGLYRRKRWTGIPSNPAAVSRLYTPLNNLINNLLDKFNLLDDHQGICRLSLNTSKGIEPQLEYPIRPSLLLAGSGKHFLASTAPCPDKHYGSGIAPIAIRLESEDKTFTQDCLCASVQELFAYQHNRRYVFGVVMSQQSLVVHMFDHSGVTYSPPLDYHSEPEQFCAIIAGLASHDAERVGLDTSLFKEGTHWELRTREVIGRKRFREVKYTVVSTLYYMAHIVGRGTICFAAFMHGERKPCVIKDSWVSLDELEGKESEASLLAHARRCGVSKGIPMIQHSEGVLVRGEASRMRPDTVLNNRHAASVDNSKYERLHTRLILTPYGKPLDKFSNRSELLLAYHDALEAHRRLYSAAGILHRDIKPGNILIYPDGEEGNRGILIDYDHAIRIADTSPYSTKRKIGTYLFMSHKAHKGVEPQTCLDDLESFYYVLVYLILLHANKAVGHDLPSPLDEWASPAAPSAKYGFLFSEFEYQTDPRFGKPLQTLVERLHSVFRKIVVQAFLAESRDESPPVVNHEEIYDMMLSHVRDAIVHLNLEQQDGIATPCNSIQEVDTQEEGLLPREAFSWIKKPKMPKKIVRTLAGTRARRNRATFRVTDTTHILDARSHRRRIKRN